MGSISNPAPSVGASVDASELGEEAVWTKHLKDGNVTAVKVGAEAIEAAAIANLAITAAKLGEEAVTAAKVKPTEVVTHAAASNKLVGKLGINNVNPPAQSADTGAANESVAITLLTEVAGAINAQAKHVNDIRACLRNHGLMA